MRVAVPIELTKQKYKTLQDYSRSRKTPVRLVEQSTIVLSAAQGKTNQMIAEQLGISQNKVGRWRNRYAQGGLCAIEKDRPRGKNHGGKKTLTPNATSEQSHTKDRSR